MKAKQLLVLLVIAAVVVAASVWLYRQRSREWTGGGESAGIGALVLPGLPVNDIVAMVVKDSAGSLRLEKRDGVWSVPDAGGYRADFEKVRALLVTLKELKVAQPVPGGDAYLERLNLQAPGEGVTAAGTLVTFLGTGDKELASLIVGKDHLQKGESPNPYMGGNWPNGKYIRVPGSGLVGLVTERFYAVTTQKANWLDKEFFKVGEKQEIGLTRAGQSVYEFKRAKKGDNLALTGLQEGEELDSGKVSALSSALSYATFDEVAAKDVKPEETGLNEPQVCRILDFDGVEYTVSIGRKTEAGKYYLTVAAKDVGLSERVKAEGETEDAAKAADAEFKKALGERQKRVQDIREKLSSWVYLVSSYTVEPILKERKDFLKAKEAAKTAEGAAQEGAGVGAVPAEGKPAAAEIVPPPPPPPPPPPAPAETQPQEAKPAPQPK